MATPESATNLRLVSPRPTRIVDPWALSDTLLMAYGLLRSSEYVRGLKTVQVNPVFNLLLRTPVTLKSMCPLRVTWYVFVTRHTGAADTGHES